MHLPHKISFLHLLLVLCCVLMFAGSTYSSGSSTLNETHPEFKTMLMYFIEPSLGSVKINGQRMEGGYSLEHSFAIVSKARQAAKRLPSSEDQVELLHFADTLEKGTLFGVELFNAEQKLKDFDFKTLYSQSLELQSRLLVILHDYPQIIIPTYWPEHAFAISITARQDGRFDLTVFNGGAGLRFHPYGPDPEGVSPYLSQLWVEFKGIPKEDIFDEESAWFIQALLAIRSPAHLTNAKETAGSFESYIYESVLANFKEYLVKDVDVGKLHPGQRAGTCSVASIMAALLYYSKDLRKFSMYRMFIGHEIVTDFLSNATGLSRVREKLLSDGFETTGRTLLNIMASALSQQLLRYLELEYPDTFHQAGLLGLKRALWLLKNKPDAMRQLAESAYLQDLISKTVNLSAKVVDLVKHSPIDPVSNHIKVPEVCTLSPMRPMNFGEYPHYSKLAVNTKNIYQFLTVPVLRESSPLESFGALVDQLENCLKMDDKFAFTTALDAFNRCSQRDWWLWIEQEESVVDVKRMLLVCSSLSRKFITNTVIPTCLEHIALLANLELASWRSAVHIDLHSSQPLGLSAFSATDCIVNIIGKTDFMRGKYNRWLTRSIFDYSTLDQLSRTLQQFRGHKSDRFQSAPMLTGNPNTNSFTVHTRSHLFTLKMKHLYSTLVEDPMVSELMIQYLEDYPSRPGDLFDKASIILQFPIKFFDKCPHFYLLMNTLFWVYRAPFVRQVMIPKEVGRNAQFYTLDPEKPRDIVGLAYSHSGHGASYDGFNSDSASYASSSGHVDMPDISQIVFDAAKSVYQKYPFSGLWKVFFESRHSEILDAHKSVVNFDVWLNYISSAPDNRIFYVRHFLYVTEKLLTAPHLKLSTEDGFELLRHPQTTYPRGFSRRFIKQTYLFLLKAIKRSLSRLTQTFDASTLEEKTKEITLATQLGIILTRFLNRLEYDRLIPAMSSAKMAAAIYQTFWPFGKLVSEFGLSESDVSGVNVLLGQIAEIPLRNAKTFLDHIDIGLAGEEEKSLISRRILSRFHRFIAQSYYVATQIGKNLVDDQFIYGSIFYPVRESESPGTDLLLTRFFLPHLGYADTVEWSLFKYADDGNIVEIYSSDQRSFVAIQLSGGVIVIDGVPTLQRKIVLNSHDFQSFFAPKDLAVASRGQLARISHTIIYLLRDFKTIGNHIVLLCSQSGQCIIHQKFDGDWFFHTNENTTLLEGLGYQHIYNGRIVKRVPTVGISAKFQEIRLYMNNEMNIKLVNLREAEDPSVLIEIAHFTKGDKWKLLNHDTKIDRHFEMFSESKKLKALTEDGRLVIIFTALRMKDNPIVPLVFVQTAQVDTTHPMEFVLLNAPDLIIEGRQEFGRESISMPGLLTACNSQGKRFVIAPLGEVEERRLLALKKVGKSGVVEKQELVCDIEVIPIFSDDVAPQDRLQALILAYYSCLSYNYPLARKLLHPTKSIHQNEPFTSVENSIVKWLVKINGFSVELLALKLMAFISSDINEHKFMCVGSKPSSKKYGSYAGASGLFGGMGVAGVIQTHVSRQYLLSLRDVSEKYSVFHIFPELMKEQLFLNVFGSASMTPSPEYIPMPLSSFQVSEKQHQIDFCFGCLNTMMARNIVRKIFKYPTVARYRAHAKFVAKMMHRKKDRSRLSNGNVEMIYYAFAKDFLFKRPDETPIYDWSRIFTFLIQNYQNLHGLSSSILNPQVSESQPDLNQFMSMREAAQDRINLETVQAFTTNRSKSLFDEFPATPFMREAASEQSFMNHPNMYGKWICATAGTEKIKEFYNQAFSRGSRSYGYPDSKKTYASIEAYREALKEQPPVPDQVKPSADPFQSSFFLLDQTQFTGGFGALTPPFFPSDQMQFDTESETMTLDQLTSAAAYAQPISLQNFLKRTSPIEFPQPFSIPFSSQPIGSQQIFPGPSVSNSFPKSANIGHNPSLMGPPQGFPSGMLVSNLSLMAPPQGFSIGRSSLGGNPTTSTHSMSPGDAKPTQYSVVKVVDGQFVLSNSGGPRVSTGHDYDGAASIFHDPFAGGSFHSHFGVPSGSSHSADPIGSFKKASAKNHAVLPGSFNMSRSHSEAGHGYQDQLMMQMAQSRRGPDSDNEDNYKDLELQVPIQACEDDFLYFLNVYDYCQRSFLNEFKTLETNAESINTSATDILATMRAERKSYKPRNEVGGPQSKSVQIIPDSVIEEIFSLSRRISGLMRDLATVSSIDIPFNYAVLGRSITLTKLRTSVSQYVEMVGGAHVPTINLAAIEGLVLELNQFKEFLQKSIAQIDFDLKKQAAELATRTESLSEMGLANLFEQVLRGMHIRKSKTFHDLYACYRQQSLACFQWKFPQLTADESLQLQKDTFVFYSKAVLLDHFRFLLKLQQAISHQTEGQEPVAVDELLFFTQEMDKSLDFNQRCQSPLILNFEFRSGKYRLRAEQVRDIDKLTAHNPHTNQVNSVVIQRMMAAGKTLVLGTISVVKKAEDSEIISILVPPSSLYQSNTTAMQLRTYDYYKVKGHTFDFSRQSPPQNKGDAVMLVSYLGYVNDLLFDTRMDHNYLILSPDSLQMFLNSYVEMIDALQPDGTGGKENISIHVIKKYSNIYFAFRTRGSIILDEIDMTMDPRKELNFPTCDYEPYNELAAALMCDLIEFASSDQDVIASGLDIIGNNQASLTSDNWVVVREMIYAYIDRQLASPSSAWSSLLQSGLEEFAEWNGENISAILRNPDVEFGRDLLLRVHQENANTANALAIIKIQLLTYLEDSLKSTVNLNYGAAGSSRDHVLYAVPFIAANTPSPSSVYADRWETLNKTLIMMAAVPCDLTTALAVFKHAKSLISRENVMDELHLPTSNYNTFASLLNGINPFDLELSNPDHVSLFHEALKPRSPAAVRLIFSYTLEKILARMEFPIEQITCNALNMASMFASIQGYSGTIDNVNTLPQEVVAEAYLDHEENEKNNGGIALKLINDSLFEATVPELSDDCFLKPVEILIKIIIESLIDRRDFINSLTAIIDTGAFLKSYKNEQVAAALLNLFEARIEVVLFYDEDSNQLSFLRRNGASLSHGTLHTTDPDEINKITQSTVETRFTFYDQRHCTGSDILQPKYAHAILTVDTRVLLRDILQGTLRMRQFMTTQRVHLVTSKAAQEFYSNLVHVASGGPSVAPLESKASKLTVLDLLTLGALNEDEKQRRENEKLAFMKIDNEFRRLVLDEICHLALNDTLKPSELTKMISLWFRENRDIFVRNIREQPMSWLTRVEVGNSATVLEQYLAYRMQPFVSVIGHHFPDIWNCDTLQGKRVAKVLDVVKKMVSPTNIHSQESLLHFLPSEIRKRVIESQGTEVQMQMKMEVLVQVDLNLEQIVEMVAKDPKQVPHDPFNISELVGNIHPLDIPSTRHFVSLHSVLHDDRMSEIHKSLTQNALITSGSQVGVSVDMIHIVAQASPTAAFKIFSRFTMEGSHLLVQVPPQNSGIRVLLISTRAAQTVFDLLSSIPADASGSAAIQGTFDFNGSTLWLCDLNGFVVSTNDSATIPEGLNILDLMPGARELIFDALIFNGSLAEILNSPCLSKLYRRTWLVPPFFRDRAKYLLVRMRLLSDKPENTFEKGHDEIEKLEQAAKGNKLYGIKQGNIARAAQSGKLSVMPDDESAFFHKRYGFVHLPRELSSRQSSKDCEIGTVFAEIIGQQIMPEGDDVGITYGLREDPVPEDLNEGEDDEDEHEHGEIQFLNYVRHPEHTTWFHVKPYGMSCKRSASTLNPELVKYYRMSDDEDDYEEEGEGMNSQSS